MALLQTTSAQGESSTTGALIEVVVEIDWDQPTDRLTQIVVTNDTGSSQRMLVRDRDGLVRGVFAIPTGQVTVPKAPINAAGLVTSEDVAGFSIELV